MTRIRTKTQGWSHRETIGTACHGSARASSSNWTFPRCRCRTAIIKGGTTLTSGFTVAPASRSNWTRCELPSSTASANIVVGCCFGGRMLGSARACKSRYVRLTPGRGNRNLWKPDTHMHQGHYLERLPVRARCWYAHHLELAM